MVNLGIMIEAYSNFSIDPIFREGQDCSFEIVPLLSLEVECNKDKTEAEYSWNKKVISGAYLPKGVFAGRIIYEKTVEDPNKMWWSLRFDAENDRWVFSYSDSKIVIGNEKFGATIQNISDEPGELIKETFSKENYKIRCKPLNENRFCKMKIQKSGRKNALYSC